MRARSKIISPEIAEDQLRLPEAGGSVKPSARRNGGVAMTAAKRRPPVVKKIVAWLAGFAVAVIALLIGLVVVYRFVPPVSTLMLARMVSGRPVDRQWVPLARISASLQAAVIMSEDGQFCRHHGVDWSALGESLHDLEQGGRVRGASTLSMQTAKNLFLWPSRSYLRKGLEIPLAVLIDFAWGKPRMLEIYLNMAQWGDGTFGAEAAARRYFHVAAADLIPHQAALLAAALPDPLHRNAAKPSHRLARLAATVLQRLDEARSHLACLPQARAETSQAPNFGVSARP
jgi:monofunctional biosynthetic peptidoglycan transglycosylase